MLRSVIAIAAVVLAAFLASCGGNNEEYEPIPMAASPVESPTAGATDMPATQSLPMANAGLWALFRGDDVNSLMGAGDTVVVARVAGIALPYDPRPGYLGWTPRACPFPSDDPRYAKCSWSPSPEEASRPAGRDFTVYEMEVLDGPASLLQGSKILAAQVGGIWDGKAYAVERSPLLQIGSTYLLSLNLSEFVSDLMGAQAYFVDAPFAQFLVDPDGKLKPVDSSWTDMPAVKALSGRTVDEALTIIESARAAITPSPVPVPTPTPEPVVTADQALSRVLRDNPLNQYFRDDPPPTTDVEAMTCVEASQQAPMVFDALPTVPDSECPLNPSNPASANEKGFLVTIRGTAASPKIPEGTQGILMAWVSENGALIDTGLRLVDWP